MERLTFEGNFCDIAQCYHLPCPHGGSCTQKQVWERLKAYEDKADEIALKLMRLADLENICSYTRLRELAEADKDGRLVVLPCKVGDTVYFRTYDCNGTIDLGIQPHKVTAIMGNTIVRGRYIDIGLLLDQYGVSWFSTREEAESALEEMKDD